MSMQQPQLVSWSETLEGLMGIFETLRELRIFVGEVSLHMGDESLPFHGCTLPGEQLAIAATRQGGRVLHSIQR
jgi:hypothetical protein